MKAYFQRYLHVMICPDTFFEGIRAEKSRAKPLLHLFISLFLAYAIWRYWQGALL